MQILKEYHFRCRQYFEVEKSQTRYNSGTHFLPKNKDNRNSLRITTQEDILSCYFTIEETWSR